VPDRRSDVLFFPGILNQVIKLGRRGQDIFPGAVYDTPQFRPAVILPGIICFNIGGEVGPFPPPDIGQKRRPPDPRRDGHPQDVQDGRHDVDEADPRGHDESGRERLPAAGDQRHLQRSVIKEKPVIDLLLFPQGLPVVPGDDDERPVQKAFILQLFEEPAEDMIDIGDLAVIFPVPVFGVERRGRGVGKMGVEEMGPAEEPFAAVLLEPGREGRENGPGIALRPEAFQRLPPLDVVVIQVEAAGESETGIQRKRGDEGRGPEALALEQRGEGRQVRTQGVGPVVMDEMVDGIHPRHDRAMRRQGQRDLGIGVGEPDPFGGQPVQVRGPGPGVPVTPETVRPHGVDRDQEDVEVPADGPRDRLDGQRQRQNKDGASADKAHRNLRSYSSRFRDSGNRPGAGRPPVNGLWTPGGKIVIMALVLDESLNKRGEA
jgi:hypothetical protein